MTAQGNALGLGTTQEKEALKDTMEILGLCPRPRDFEGMALVFQSRREERGMPRCG